MYIFIKGLYSFIYLFIYYNHICISLSRAYIVLPYMYMLVKGLYRSLLSCR